MADQVCTIGNNITVNGNLTGAEDLVVEGRVEGTIKLSNHLTVESSGVVAADLDVEDLTINGVVQGDIQATHSVAISSGARVEGNIRVPRLVIEEGARFRGRIEMDVDLPDDVGGE